MRLRNRGAFGAGALAPSALLLAGIIALPAGLSAQTVPAALKAGEAPAAGLQYTDGEKQLAALFAGLRVVPGEQPSSLSIWCDESSVCDALRDLSAGLPVRPALRLVDRAQLGGKLAASAKQFAKGAPKQRPKLSLPALKDAAGDGVSVLAVIADKGMYYAAELLPGKGAGAYEIASLPVAGASLDEVRQRFRDLVGKLLASKKLANPADADTRSDLAAPLAGELAWGELREQTRTRAPSESLTRGFKDNLHEDGVLAFDAARCSLLKGKGSLADCVRITNLRAQFRSINQAEVRGAGGVDLIREGLMSPVATQGGYQSDASWALGYAAYGNVLARAKQAGVLNPATATNIDAGQLHNLAKYKKAGKALALGKGDAKLKGVLGQLDNSQASDARGCYGGTSLPQLAALVGALEPAALNGEASSCGGASNVLGRGTPGVMPAPPMQIIDADIDAIRAALLQRSAVVVSAPTALFDGYAGGVVSNAPARDASSAASWTQSYYQSGGPRGHHAVVVVGFDNNERTFKLQNSWGPGWGEGGTMRVHFDVFRAWFHDVAYYFDCVGPCLPQRSPVATLSLDLGVDYGAYKDTLSGPDPLVRVRKNGGLVCELSAQDKSVVQGSCAPQDIAPNDQLTLELWERDANSMDYLGGFRYAPINAPGESEWTRFHLRGGQTLALEVPKEVKSLFKEGATPAGQSRTGGKRERTTVAPGRPGAERKK